MVLRDPIAAYNAGSNTEAHLVCGLLHEAGIEAVALEDNSQAGVWIGGTIPVIHKPQVWIERNDGERARPVLADYERRNVERWNAKPGLAVDVVCEKCGERSTFPSALQGTVQNCPHCRAYVDVGEDASVRDRHVESSLNVEQPQSWIWFAPWRWGRQEYQRLILWAVVIVIILSSVAPGVVQWVTNNISIPYVFQSVWRMLFSLFG